MASSKRNVKFNDANQHFETHSPNDYDRKKITRSLNSKIYECTSCPQGMIYDNLCTGNPRSSKYYPCRGDNGDCYDCDGDVSVKVHPLQTLQKSQQRQKIQSREQRDERRELARQLKYEKEHRHDMVFLSVQTYLINNDQYLPLYQSMFDSFAGMIDHIKELPTTPKILKEYMDMGLETVGKMLLDSI